MTGARKLAFDYILPRIPTRSRVLDVGAGDSPLAAELTARGCQVCAIDRDADRLYGVGVAIERHCIDVTRPTWKGLEGRMFDRIVAVYSLQHLLDDEARTWTKCREMLADGGALIVVGRLRDDCAREYQRGDPLNGYNRVGLEAMAMACGLRMSDFAAFAYEGDEYRFTSGNAFAATFTRWA